MQGNKLMLKNSFQKIVGLLFGFGIILSAGIACCSIYDENKKDSFNYNPYLNKIWVVVDQVGDIQTYQFSFIITKIENGIIEGKFSMGGIMNPCINNITNYGWENFCGTILNGMAECLLVSNDNATSVYVANPGGYRGKVSFRLKTDNIIEIKAKYEKFNETPLISGTYLCRPYNLADVTSGDIGLALVKKDSYRVYLESWGTVNFVVGVVSNEQCNNEYPIVCFVDEDDNVLCDFRERIRTDDEIIEIMIEDYNNDGLKDVKIITAPFEFKIDSAIDAPEKYVEWVYYQVKNGWFYLC